MICRTSDNWRELMDHFPNHHIPHIPLTSRRVFLPDISCPGHFSAWWRPAGVWSVWSPPRCWWPWWGWKLGSKWRHPQSLKLYFKFKNIAVNYRPVTESLDRTSWGGTSKLRERVRKIILNLEFTHFEPPAVQLLNVCFVWHLPDSPEVHSLVLVDAGQHKEYSRPLGEGFKK